jgi:phosphohistidine phosphatase
MAGLAIRITLPSSHMAMTRLILMRHAKSDWYSGELDDFQRPLNDRGVRDARRMGQWLAEAELLAAEILSSPSRRTRETLACVSEGAGLDLTARTRWIDAIYHASRERLLEVLAQAAPAADLMLLGHNPGLEELLEFLAAVYRRDADAHKPFPTGAVYVLECDCGLDALTRRCARVAAQQRPKWLVR